jgi:predicted transcriptional regulator
MNPEKTKFVENVKHWAALEKQLKTINEKTRELRAQKSELVDTISQYMETHPISNNTIQLTDGHIRLTERKEYAPLSFSYVEECLETLIPEKSHVDAIMDYLYEHREMRVSKELKRTYHNV